MPRWVRAVLGAKKDPQNIRWIVRMLGLIGIYPYGRGTECYLLRPNLSFGWTPVRSPYLSKTSKFTQTDHTNRTVRKKSMLCKMEALVTLAVYIVGSFPLCIYGKVKRSDTHLASNVLQLKFTFQAFALKMHFNDAAWWLNAITIQFCELQSSLPW